MLLALVVVVTVVSLVLLVAQGLGDEPAVPSEKDMADVSGIGSTHRPPWELPADVAARATAAGLSLGPMGMAEHYHVYVDVLVDGSSVGVPADIGVDPASGAMTGLHTHTPDGIVHVEAEREGQLFTLGQLFTQWDVRLTDEQLGALRAGNGTQLSVYVNGDRVQDGYATVPLAAGQTIAVVYGATDAPVDIPTDHDFGPDLV